MSSLYNSINEINNIKSKRIYLEEEDQNEISNYVQRKKIKLTENENGKDECNCLNFKQKNLLPPSPPLDYMNCQSWYEDEEYKNFSLDHFQNENDFTCTSSTSNIEKEENIQDFSNDNNNDNNKVLIFNTNIQHKKKYTPKFTIGYRSDCKKCRERVPNHYGHIN